jgi:metal-dependent hydrolase (beta-lactamase superfamily II)
MTMRSILLTAGIAFNAVCSVSLAAEPVENYYQVVFDTTGGVAKKGFRTGFGYSLFVQFEGKRLLFDLGADADTLLHNLRAAGIDPAKLDAIAISHNHFDHRQ